MDGFKNSDGVFIVGASNRIDLLDPALIRPGRIDKRIFIGLPDSNTRRAILNIHIKGKPHDDTINVEDMVDLTTGMSAAQIENLLNEAMLFALRNKRVVFTLTDVEVVMNRVVAGWQPNEHQFSEDIIERITIHEMGHAMIGLLMKQHSKLTKIVINLSSPNTPGYTMFEGSTSSMYTRDSLFEHLMILVAGRVAEEIFYNVSVTTGAINDFEEALKLAEKMVLYYGMGANLIYPSNSEKFKTKIDEQVLILIQNAYKMSDYILRNCKSVMIECAVILKKKKILKREELLEIIWNKYPEVMALYQGEP
jgi:cell division protease FtsH